LVVLDVVVTPQGTSAGEKILKDPGYGFAEKAIEALRGWRFRPAVDKDKNPIAARVQMEFAFHD
jgi:TonB family protein